MRCSNNILTRGHSTYLVLFLFILLAGLALPAGAQTNVTIPKSRLEELEKKEAELEKLRNQLNPPKPVQVEQTGVKAQQPSVTGKEPVPDIKAVPEPVHISPALSTLPDLKEGEVVSAIDLASHYEQDRVAADQRYLKKNFAVQGEIERFEKRAFGRYYSIIMKTGGSKLKVICEVYPPERYTAVYTADHNSKIVGMFSGENLKTLASADSIAVARGECKGLEDSIIKIKGCALKSVRPVGN
jgi:hypothetical protein